LTETHVWSMMPRSAVDGLEGRGKAACGTVELPLRRTIRLRSRDSPQAHEPGDEAVGDGGGDEPHSGFHEY